MTRHLASFLGLLLAAFATGCSYDVEPPGSEECPLAMRSPATVFAEYRVSGGLAGINETSYAHDDGKVSVQPDGDSEPTVAEHGVDAANQLRDALDGSGVYDVEQGCYQADKEVNDGVATVLFLRDRDGATFLFSTSDGADTPEELEGAIQLVRGYVGSGL